MSILIKKQGMLTTIQDLGRTGLRRFGINPNGAMDKIAVRLINILLGNEENEAVLEMHFPAPEIIFEQDTIFALGGANFDAKLDDQKIENWRLYQAENGNTLKFDRIIKGSCIYLSVKGGFKINKWLESSSTNLIAEIGGFEGRILKRNDRIEFNQSIDPDVPISKHKISNSLIPYYSNFPTVRITENPEFNLLTAFSQEVLLKENFEISKNSNRMGFRLQGSPLFLLNEKELLSTAVNFGTIQLLPDGQLIILMADHQTTGGYPRIAGIIPTDLPLVAQLGAGKKIAFHLISLEEAENLSVQFENDLKLLKIGVKLTH